MAHQKHSWERVGGTLVTETVMDDWLGPTLALLRWDCGQYAIAHLVAWTGKGLSARIFAVRQLDTTTAETWRRNVARDYCDLTRKQSETETLLQASEDSATLILTGAPELDVLAVSATTANPPFIPWQEVLEDDFPGWRDKYFQDNEINQPEPGLS